MKKLVFTLMLIVMVFALYANSNVKILHPKMKVLSSKNGSRGEVYYQEDFEGEQTWTTQDGTLPSAMWHLDDFNTPDGSGLSWWMGDPELGGYLNHMYLVLDTDEITVPTNGHLTFDLNYSVEAPGVYQNWDGWDGCNIRISTDGGNTWNVIEGTPAYNCQSMYSFGFEHGEGEGVPGWGGSSNGWVNADFDLSSYAGQDVRIRFAFASDPAYCTQDDPSLFGMIVDNIQLGSFENTGEEAGMTSSSMVPVGGDIWHLAEVADAPSPTHAMVCQNDEGSYNVNMLDYWISDTITLPQSDEIIADFMVKGNFTDPDQFPDVDYFGWEITPDDGLHWYAMSNPTGDPDGTNYVYSEVPETWSSMIESYSLDGNISMYAGQDVKFRIFFQTDADTPEGTGIMIDDFTITYTVGEPPTNLQAELNEEGNVHLTWTAPGTGGGQEGWIHWDDGVNSDGIGTGDAAVLDAAARFTSAELIQGSITKIKFFPKEENCSYTLKVWTGTSGSNLIYEQEVPNPVIEDWNEIDLDTPVAVDPSVNYWIGYTADTQTGYPLGCDAGPMVPDRGGYIRLNGGSWGQLADYGLDYNWNIQAYLAGTNGQTVVMGATTPSKDVSGYKIYRSIDGQSFDEIAEIQPAEEYTDESPEINQTNYYYVKALYDGMESAPSNTVNIFVPDLSGVELAYDDGTAESSLAPASGEVIAVKYDPQAEPGHGYNLQYVKLYINDLGNASQILLRIFDEMNGEPNMLFQFAYSTDFLTQGWNFVPIPENYLEQAHFNDVFYIGIFALPGSPSYGIDTNNTGSSYLYSNAEWSDFTSGNAMIRALGNYTVSSNSDNIVQAKINASNYPNPFNPVTTIKYNVPVSGKVTVNIYNIAGQKVKTLVNENQKAGLNQVVWNGTDENGKTVSSGVYLYKIKSGKHTSTQKMILMK